MFLVWRLFDNDRVEVYDTKDSTFEIYTKRELFSIVNSGIYVNGVNKLRQSVEVFNPLNYFNKVRLLGDNRFNYTLTATSIGDTLEAYSCKIKGKEVKIPYGVSIISNLSLSGETEYVSLPESLFVVGYHSFSGSNIKSINLPDGVNVIQSNSFSKCKNLIEFNAPADLVRIEDTAFFKCENLRKVKLNDSLNSLGSHCFNSCYNLSSIKIPDKITLIPTGCFDNCSRLKKIELPEGLVGIEKSFCYCMNLKTITLPSTLRYIDKDCFELTCLKEIRCSNPYVLRLCKNLNLETPCKFTLNI